MPAGAALSSSRRTAKQRRMMQASQRGSATGRRPPGQPDSFTMGSQRNLTGGSNRNLMGGSSRNLMRPPPDSARRRGDGSLTVSMPRLDESRKQLTSSIISGIDDSTRSNPELFLTRGGDENEFSSGEIQLDDENDSSFNLSNGIEMRHRKNPLNGEQGGSQLLDQKGTRNNLQHAPAQNKYEDAPRRGSAIRSSQRSSQYSSQLSSLNRRSRDSFIEHAVAESTSPTSPTTMEKLSESPWIKPFDNLRKFAGKVINDYRVQNVVLLLIMINAIMMGVATAPSIKNNPDMLRIFELCDQIFLIIFTIESIMQLLFHGWTLFKDGFLVFDLLIVVMSWALTGAQVFRAFRIFRAMRLITRINTLKNLVQALFSVVPKMTAIFMLLMLIFYIFAVMFTALFKGMFVEGLVDFPYFETLYDSLFTLFQMMTLDEWAAIMIEIQVTFSWAWLPFVVFIVITGFVVVNLIIAVICDAVHVLGEGGKSGLIGTNSEEYQSGMDDPSYEGEPNNAYDSETITKEMRLQQLQQQLDDMVTAQKQMQDTIGILVQQLRDNAARESTSVLIERRREAGDRILRFRTSAMPPTHSLGENIPRSGPAGERCRTHDSLGDGNLPRTRTKRATAQTPKPPDGVQRLSSQTM